MPCENEARHLLEGNPALLFELAVLAEIPGEAHLYNVLHCVLLRKGLIRLELRFGQVW